jgi:hypothetical protein
VLGWIAPGSGADAYRAAHLRLALGAGALAAGAVLLARAAWTNDERTTLGWLLLGSLLGLVPLAAVRADDRLLLIPSAGAAAVLAGVLAAAWRRARDGARGRAGALALAALALPLGALHLLHDPITGARDLARWRDANRRIVAGFRASPLADRDLAGREAIVIAAPDMTTGIHGMFVLGGVGLPVPRAWHVLSMTPRPHLVVRVDRRTIDVSAVGGGMLRQTSERFFRPAGPLATGDRLGSGEMEVEILALGGGPPDRIRFRFPRDLDDPRYLFLVPERDGLRPFALPAVGRSALTALPRLPERAP